MCSLQKIGSIYLLTLTGPGEHRLNPTLIRSLKSALHHIKNDSVSSSSALVTTNEGKFFSNGFDLDYARSTKSTLTKSGSNSKKTDDYPEQFAVSDPNPKNTMVREFMSLIEDLIALPMPTIAAVTGHAAAAGFIFALSHDYVIMRKERGFLYMSEVDIGLVVPELFVEVVKSKVGSGMRRRDVFLKAEKLTGEVGMDMGLVDEVVEGKDETVARGVRLGEELVKRGWMGHVYGANRLVVLSDVIKAIEIEKVRVGPSRL